MTYRKALKYLNKLGIFRMKFGLERIKGFLGKIGNPQNELKVIHIAGTNGKGSVSAFISTILKEVGYKVGLYTSPHLIDVRERIQINGKKISQKDFTEFVSNYSLQVKTCDYKNRNSLTYFELLTAMAFWYFQKKKLILL